MERRAYVGIIGPGGVYGESAGGGAERGGRRLSGGWGVRHDWEDSGEYYSIDLLFKGDAPLGVGNQYTIAELCGEEK